MLVLAYGAQSSLEAALNMMREWDVVYLHDLAEVEPLEEEASILLLGGGTTEGLRLVSELRERGSTVPVVVLGDDAGGDGSVPVLVPPYSLDELRACVERTARATTVTHAAFGDPYAYNDADEDADDAPEEAEAEDWFVEPLRVIEEGESDDAREHSPAAHTEPAPGGDAQAAGEAPLVRVERSARPEDRPAPEARRRMRRRARPAAVTLEQRISEAARAMGEVERLIDEIPVLADLDELAEVLVAEILEKTRAETVAMFLFSGHAYHVRAAHGLSNAERALPVAHDHPLFSQLAATRRALLISPVELAQGLVAGVGGARTRALIAAPVVVDGRQIGVVTAGRDFFSDGDLDAVEALAREAGPGIAVAGAVSRLRA